MTADGTSTLTDASIEPEVMHTIEFLNKAGGDIVVHEGGTIEVVGTDSLRSTGYEVPVDRLEAGTLAIAAAITGGRILLENARLSDFPHAFLKTLGASGTKMWDSADGLEISATADITAVVFATGPHPGFPTDLQPQMTALLTRARGRSEVLEAVYPQRATHVHGLRAFGADVGEDGRRLIINGPRKLTAADVSGVDIRCVTALLLAALTAEGTSRISGIYHLNRGYSSLLRKLTGLGARVSYSETEAEM
ncbi:hypothetical protein [Streptosporangium sp. KLBMP 9127]|nr:hypothetical protein [Streptosporangium sp. KLBMP 9127]